MANLALTYAGMAYDRIQALVRGEVKPAGIDLNLPAFDGVGGIFAGMGRGEFDAAEFSVTEYISRMSRGDCPLVGLPIFPSRGFRHGYICINRRSGIRTPRDLEGRRVGTSTYTIADMVWTRGLLEHEYGVDLSRIRWVASTAGVNRPMLPVHRPVAIENNPRPLAQLLVEGEIDAIMYGTPWAFPGHPDIQRLLPDFHEAERQYYRRTRIHPVLHMVVMRRELHEQHPWVAEHLFRAFCEAKDLALKKLHNLGALPYMLPWLAADIEEIERVFDGDPWPYGLAANRPTLEALVNYMHEQALIPSPIALEELFVPLG
jgi:4,5-dihydroxyphthalate decarboxylase